MVDWASAELNVASMGVRTAAGNTSIVFILREKIVKIIYRRLISLHTFQFIPVGATPVHSAWTFILPSTDET